jgi:ActR/RegA family two-component response regulator
MAVDPSKVAVRVARTGTGREQEWRSLVEALPAVRASALPAGGAEAPWPSLERIQWEYIHAVLDSCGGNISEAARQLGVHRQSLQRMLRRLPPRR